MSATPVVQAWLGRLFAAHHEREPTPLALVLYQMHHTVRGGALAVRGGSKTSAGALAAAPCHRHVGRIVAAAAAKAGPRFVVPATWSARCKACGDRYTEGTSVTKNELGWVHEECAAT